MKTSTVIVVLLLIFTCFLLVDRLQEESGFSAQQWALSLGMTPDGAKAFRHDYLQAKIDGKPKPSPYSYAKDHPWVIDWDKRQDSELACATRQGIYNGFDPSETFR